jgi:hypothetical protein
MGEVKMINKTNKIKRKTNPIVNIIKIAAKITRIEATVSIIVEAMIRMYKLEKAKIATTPKMMNNQLMTKTIVPSSIICAYHQR